METRRGYIDSDANTRVKSGNTITYKILKFIWESEKIGRKYSEILRFILDLKGIESSRSKRGYWATSLLGDRHTGRGILRIYCKKNEDGRWVLTDINLKKHFLLTQTEEFKGMDAMDIEIINTLGMFESIIEEDMIAPMDSNIGSPGEFYQHPDSMTTSMDVFSLSGPIKTKGKKIKKSNKKESSILSFNDFIKSIRK